MNDSGRLFYGKSLRIPVRILGLLAVFTILAPTNLALGIGCPSTPTTLTGGALMVTNVSGSPVTGTLQTSADVLDGSYYRVTNLAPSSMIDPTGTVMVSDWVENGMNLGSGKGGLPVYYGGVFSNPTAAAMTITSVDFTSSGTGNFWGLNTQVTPSSGWTFVNSGKIRWVGSLSVAANSGQAFIFSAETVQSTAPVNFTVNMIVHVGATSYTSANFLQHTPGSPHPYSAGAIVGFDSLGAAMYTPETYIGVFGSSPFTLGIRVREAANNANPLTGIARNLTLSVTVPAGWSAVSFSTIAAPFDPTTAVYVQPTATTAGSATIHTLNTVSGSILAGASSTAGALKLSATPPSGSFATSLYAFDFALNGQTLDSPSAPVVSVNHSIVRQINGASATGVEADFSGSILLSPIRQVYFEADFNLTGGTGAETVNVDFWNYATSSWTTIATASSGSSNSVVIRTFLADYAVFSSGGAMQVRLISLGSVSRTLGIDYLGFVRTPGYTVNNATGNDANVPGDVANPLATIAKALSTVTANIFAVNAIYVEVGNSQSGAPYVANNVLSKTPPAPACTTIYEGIASGGLRPLIRGQDPTADVGFDIRSSYQLVDNFQISNTQVGLYVESNFASNTVSNNYVQVPDLAYGIILDSGSGQEVVRGNRVDATGTNSFIGIWEYAPNSANTIDGNKLSGHAFDAIRSDGTNGTVFERNIVKSNWAGIHIAGAAGPVSVWNNTADGNSYFGIYVEQSPGRTVTSRNNILKGNLYGWAWDGLGTINSDYEDVYSNTHNYSYTVPVLVGSHSISADPSFVQTTNPELATYYQLNVGSPCVDAGTIAGIPWSGWLGLNPDLGAVESH